MSRRIAGLAVVLGLLLAGSSFLEAQIPPAGLPRAQVSRADSAAVLLSAARAFQVEGREEVAEALLHFIGERFGRTPAGVEARDVLARLAVGVSSSASRVELQVWSSLYGLWLGLAVPGALGADGSEAYGAGLLVGVPGGFLAGRALARSRPFSEGQVRAITFGGTWGTWQGIALAELLDWGEGEVCGDFGCFPEDDNGQELLAGGVLGGLTGVAAGAVLARRPISSALATTVNFGALWGSWFGLAGGVLADLEGDALLGAALAGGDAGLLAAALGRGWGLSRNRARLVSIGGVIGGLLGAGVDLLAQPEGEKALISIPLAGSLLGLGVGAAVTREQGTITGGEGRVREGRTAATGGSLLRVSGGSVNLGMPAPRLVLLPADRRGEMAWRPGAAMTLIRAEF